MYVAYGVIPRIGIQRHGHSRNGRNHRITSWGGATPPSFFVCYIQQGLLTGHHTASRYYVDVMMFLWYTNKKAKIRKRFLIHGIQVLSFIWKDLLKVLSFRKNKKICPCEKRTRARKESPEDKSLDLRRRDFPQFWIGFNATELSLIFNFEVKSTKKHSYKENIMLT